MIQDQRNMTDFRWVLRPEDNGITLYGSGLDCLMWTEEPEPQWIEATAAVKQLLDGLGIKVMD